MKQRDLIFGIIAIIIIFCGILITAALLGVFGGMESYQQLLAAMLSVAATVVITGVLLHYQMEQQERQNLAQRSFEASLSEKQQQTEAEQVRKTKIFEEKLRIYQEFMHKLCDVVKDGYVTKEEARELQFQTAYITMHTDRRRIRAISNCVKVIIENTVNQKGRPESEKAEREERILQSLFVLVEQFKAELYEQQKDIDEWKDDDELLNFYDEAIQNYKRIKPDEDAREAEPIVVKLTADQPLFIAQNAGAASIAPESKGTEAPTLEQNIKDFGEELKQRMADRYNRWFPTVNPDANDEGLEFYLEYKGDGSRNYLNTIYVCMSYENGQHYFQVHIEHPEYEDTYQFIKWQFGGRQNKWSWWQYLEGSWKFLVKSSDFTTRSWERPLKHITSKLNQLMDWVERFMQVRENVYLPLQNADGRAHVRMRKNYLVIFDYADPTAPSSTFVRRTTASTSSVWATVNTMPTTCRSGLPRWAIRARSWTTRNVTSSPTE